MGLRARGQVCVACGLSLLTKALTPANVTTVLLKIDLKHARFFPQEDRYFSL